MKSLPAAAGVALRTVMVRRLPVMMLLISTVPRADQDDGAKDVRRVVLIALHS